MRNQTDVPEVRQLRVVPAVTNNDLHSVDDWSAILDQFDDSTFFQSLPYGLAKWGSEGVSQITVQDSIQTVAACQLWIKKIPVLKLGFAHAPWGPMWQRTGSSVDLEVLESILAALIDEYARKQRLMLRLRFNLLADTPEGTAAANLARAMGFLPVRTPDYPSIRVDLRHSLDRLRSNLRSTWRRRLNQTERQGLEIEQGTNSHMLGRFEKIYREFVGMKQLSQHVMDPKLLHATQATFPERHKTTILICTHEGVDVGGIVVFRFGNTAMYELGARSGVCMDRKLYAAHRLLWRAIEWLKTTPTTYFELRGTQVENIRRFKEGLGGEPIQYLGSWEYRKALASSLAVKGAERWAGTTDKLRRMRLGRSDRN